MFNSEKLGVGKPEDCSWQSAGFRRPASQVGWYEPVDFFLPLFLLPLAPHQNTLLNHKQSGLPVKLFSWRSQAEQAPCHPGAPGKGEMRQPHQWVGAQPEPAPQDGQGSSGCTG